MPSLTRRQAKQADSASKTDRARLAAMDSELSLSHMESQASSQHSDFLPPPSQVHRSSSKRAVTRTSTSGGSYLHHPSRRGGVSGGSFTEQITPARSNVSGALHLAETSPWAAQYHKVRAIAKSTRVGVECVVHGSSLRCCLSCLEQVRYLSHVCLLFCTIDPSMISLSTQRTL